MNTDDFNTHTRLAAQWTASQLSAEHTRYLLFLEQVVRLGTFTLVHASLRGPVYEYLVSKESTMGTFGLMESRSSDWWATLTSRLSDVRPAHRAGSTLSLSTKMYPCGRSG